ncbi:MAG: helix-turn-helix domain-containing protein [Sphingobium sp.]|nr:helix-turn-helix domain-containing protein [Sphingobium sp.]
MTKRTDTSQPGNRDQTEPAEGKAETPELICVRVATAVKLTGIGRSTLYELINSGDIETVKVGRSTFILYRSLRRLFEKH